MNSFNSTLEKVFFPSKGTENEQIDCFGSHSKYMYMSMGQISPFKRYLSMEMYAFR